MTQAVNESKKMTLNEANAILDSVEMPDHIRDYLDRASIQNYDFKYSASENSFKMVDLLPVMNESLNEDKEWTSVTEEGKIALDELIWEGIYAFITTDDINEGFWSSIVSGAKKAYGYGAKGLKAAWKLVSNIGSFIKAMIKTTAEGAKKVLKYAVGMGKKVVSGVKSKAEERAGKLRQHSEEQIDKDQADLGATVEWFTGKGVGGGINDGVKNAGGVAQTALGADQEGKKEELDDIQKKMAEEKGKGKSGQQQSNKPNESYKHAYDVLEYLQTLDEEDLLEFFAFCTAVEIGKRAEALNESVNESFISNSLSEMDMTEGLLDKIGKAFGMKDDKEKKDETPEEEKREEELAAKDQAAIEKAKQPEQPEGNPVNRAEEKATKAEKTAEDGESSVWKILGKIGRIILQGPVFIVEWVAENGLKKGLKFLSACVKKLGGPGVFLMITIAAIGAIILGLATESIVASGVLGEHSKIAGFFHMSLAGMAASALESLALSLAKTSMPILHWVPVALGVYFGVMHIKHILHDKAMGKNVNHSKAIELEKEEAEKDRTLAEETDDEELKKLLKEKADLHDQTIAFHKDMRARKIKISEFEKEIKQAKEAAKEALKKSGAKDEEEGLQDILDDLKSMKSKMKKESDPEEKDYYQGKVDDLQKQLDSQKESLKKKAGDENFAAIEKPRELEKKLHDMEHELQHDFDEFFKGEDSPHKKIQDIAAKIKRLKEQDKIEAGGARESREELFDYKSFINEKEDVRHTYVDELRKSYLREHSSLRESENERVIDEWITNNLGVNMDREFYELMSSAKFRNKKLNEDQTDLDPKLRSLYNSVATRFSDLKANTLDTWDRWTYKESLPKEVEKAAKDLKVPFSSVIFFNDYDNPDAYELFLQKLPSITKEFKTGEYQNRLGDNLRFLVVNNI